MRFDLGDAQNHILCTCLPKYDKYMILSSKIGHSSTIVQIIARVYGEFRQNECFDFTRCGMNAKGGRTTSVEEIQEIQPLMHNVMHSA